MPKNSNESSYPKFFLFLKEKEKANESFSIQDVATSLNLKKATVQKYINEKLKTHLSLDKTLGTQMYYSKDISLMKLNDFIKIMTQGYKVKELTDIELFYNKLLHKSFDAFTIALEIYNRPTLRNKVEIFVILIINAWEILLKAKLIKDNNNIETIYVKRDKLTKSGDPFTISIYDSIKKIGKENDVKYKNLSEIIYLRDKATHLLIEELRSDLSPLFQSSIINYIEEYEQSFNKIPLINEPTGMLTLVIPGNFNVFEIKKIYGDKTAMEIEKFFAKLKLTQNELNSDNFMCNINYSIYLEKKQEKANINVNLVHDDENAVNVKIIKQKTNLKETYPLKFTDIVKQINAKYNKFNKFTLTAFLKKHSIKGNEYYHNYYEGVERYSTKLTTFILTTISNDYKFFENIKQS